MILVKSNLWSIPKGLEEQGNKGKILQGTREQWNLRLSIFFGGGCWWWGEGVRGWGGEGICGGKSIFEIGNKKRKIMGKWEWSPLSRLFFLRICKLIASSKFPVKNREILTLSSSVTRLSSVGSEQAKTWLACFRPATLWRHARG